jgi:hypothetical protein
MADTVANPPVRTFSAGCLSVAVFSHAGKAPDHRVWFSASAQRSYKRDGSPDWERTTAFNRDDLPVVAELLNCAFRWIITAEATARANEAKLRAEGK